MSEERLAQEVALLAVKADVREELDRLSAHVQDALALIASGSTKGSGGVGRKLDFLSQEFNREANTLLSKTTGVAGEALRITELGLAMKSEIEQAKEQVQNLE